ncbi:HisA/HisF-related TIM barrel protein [Cupriavidus sp. USMAHM13]|uniref:HisA/HisF-related TIM barrel protein n=1 Tax=Cupriavidus sp. USMAHM13 TaxID=1389192 RepID=UPI003FA4D112
MPARPSAAISSSASDAKDGKVATDGWSKLTGHEVVDLARKVRGMASKPSSIPTSVAMGMLQGINIEATVKLAQSMSIPVIAKRRASPTWPTSITCARSRARRGRRDLRPRDLLG